MKRFVLLLALSVNFLIGSALAVAIGAPPVAGGIALNALSTLTCGIEGLRAGVYTEVWTGEMIKKFRTSAESIGWYNRIRSYDQYAGNDVIHFVDIGGDPDVLINNSTYPIPVQGIADADKAIGLDKYQTKATPITDDELYAISYDKMQSVIDRHKDAIEEKKYSKAIHALAPAGHTDGTPVILTTGAGIGGGGTRAMITRADIIALKKSFDGAKIPLSGRILVLCNDHVNDLLSADQKFSEQYYNYTTGKVTNLYGFEVYEFVDCPHYVIATKVKKAWGVAPGAADSQASVAFYAPRMMKATGTTKMYYSEAKTDPTTQQSLVNFRHYSITLPLKNEAIGAIISGVAPVDEE
jgi:hypothetical protein